MRRDSTLRRAPALAEKARRTAISEQLGLRFDLVTNALLELVTSRSTIVDAGVAVTQLDLVPT